MTLFLATVVLSYHSRRRISTLTWYVSGRGQFTSARASVDMGAWLLETQLVRRIRFSDMRTAPSRRDVLAEDDFFNDNLIAAGVRVQATGRATLRYYLGGHSTAPEDNEPADW
ncbi:hypothetical protein [Nonomuraea sp. NPDC049709]|uniref:hypothetical protein n=1 Tax=Nonomuraea sp. NPDC049709 TaxID=3154736 RepID=UPI0034151AFC